MSPGSISACALVAASLLCVAPAQADEYGALPNRADIPSSGDKPDFRKLLREAAPVGKAEAAEPEAPPPPPQEERASAAPPAPEEERASAPAPRPELLQRGLAAWYQHPGKTASGETYDPEGLTAAHRTLPLGERIRVVYPKTGKEVTVRITDRISRKALQRRPLAIELSRRGAREIGLEGVGAVAIYKAAAD